MLVPPDNFGLVEPGVYRCTKIDGDNFPFLETLNLKSLVLLDAEKPPRTVISFLETNDVELFNIGEMKVSNHQHTGKKGDKLTVPTRSKNEQWMLLEKNLIVKAFEILLNKDRHNVLLVDSTSTLVGILRKMQKWDFNSILNEYRTYSGTKSTYYAATFLELVQIELAGYEGEKRPAEAADGGLELPQSVWEESDEDEASLSFDDDDIDDEVLSASPQIPANLLKMVEQRKQEISHGPHTPESSPVSRGSFQERRRSSVSANRFRSAGSVPKHRGLSFSSMPHAIEYNYYKNSAKSRFDHVSVIQLRLPPEWKLPEWFIRGRNYWEHYVKHATRESYLER
ncbi:protein Oca4p [Diutina catenulata]